MSVDKSKVREDYVGGLSVRAIALKYNIPKSTVGDWIKRYGWTQEVKVKRICATHSKPDRKPDSKAGHPDSRTEAPEISLADYNLLRSYVMKILAKADQLLDLDDALAPRDLKSLTSMIMDARVLMGALSPAEAREQELKIESMEKGLEQASASTEPITVKFVDTEGAER